MSDEREQKIEDYCYKNVFDMMDNFEDTFGVPMSESSLVEKIKIQVDSILKEVGNVYLPGRDELINRVKNRLEIDKSITYGSASVLADKYSDHKEWLNEQYISNNKWPHWKSFRKFLRDGGAGINQLR